MLMSPAESAASLNDAIARALNRYWMARTGASLAELRVDGTSCWALQLRFCSEGNAPLQIRTVEAGDARLILAFGNRLSARAQEMFCPYPWHDPARLPPAVAAGVQQAIRHVDASYLLMDGAAPAGHFFLWKAGGNAHSLAHGVQVPELGIAIADGWQGQGLGGLAVRLLLEVARSLGADAVELTTALDNEPGWRTYLGAGFAHVGNIRNPLDVDVTAAIAGEAQAARYREERQMVYLVNPAREVAVMQYLALKRALSEAPPAGLAG
jgi:GNAT superfamily N-acetyltransferase